MKTLQLMGLGAVCRIGAVLAFGFVPAAGWSQTVSAVVENAAATQITVSGTNFGTATPTVKLGTTALAVASFSATSLVATLPTGKAGSYPLVVTNNTAKTSSTAFDVTLGVQGPVGPVGAKGATGATGPAGKTGAMGPSGPTGHSGEQGPTGASGGQVWSSNFQVPSDFGNNTYLFGSATGFATPSQNPHLVETLAATTCTPGPFQAKVLGAASGGTATIKWYYEANSMEVFQLGGGNYVELTSCTINAGAGQSVASCTGNVNTTLYPGLPLLVQISNPNGLNAFAGSSVFTYFSCQ